MNNNTNDVIDLNIKTGAFIKKHRISKGWNGVLFGSLLFISQQQVSRYETGKNILSITMLNQCLTVLGLTWDDYIREVIYKNTDINNIDVII
ncbi:helix-turn-helix domain-containing protein [Proteus hauseri]|uniref:DNA-binding repressor n=1 Tax=Proteus hauseri ATCC 700826 TaxID=1354271 RepID=A0AAJ3LUX5_PROHU|nr:helix-turn-helix transcriptional regulator [Proteus hauseri]OAT49461.1 DNA-binding repressor [Proteus hauseri ATCC 700826]QAV23429.1 XRE family transcriptional regulator [Proteus hauseri]